MGILLLLVGLLGLVSGGTKLRERRRSGTGPTALASAEAGGGVVTVIGAAAGLATVRPLAWTLVLATVCLIVLSSIEHVHRAVRRRKRRQESEGERLRAFLQSGTKLLLATVLWSSCGQPASENGGEPAVLAADSARIAAMVSADTVGLDSLFHHSLTYIHSNGLIDSKESLVGNLAAGRFDYLSVESENPLVRVHGDAAVITGVVRMEVAAGETIHRLGSNYTAVYWWEGDRWQMAAYQSGQAGEP